MESFWRDISLTVVALVVLCAAPAAGVDLAPAEEAAVFKAAGFK